jgi:hypothetical protein
MTAAHCAFERCQAGGAILSGAPRVEPWGESGFGYHPGCWAAEQARTVDYGDPPFETGPPATITAIGNLAPPLDQRCACRDGQGMPCPYIAGDDGWCDACRSHANPPAEVIFS